MIVWHHSPSDSRQYDIISPLCFKVVFRKKENENLVIEAEEKETQEYKGLPKGTRLFYQFSVVSLGQ